MPDTLAPIESKIIDNQAPLKPVCPVTNIFLFLKIFQILSPSFPWWIISTG